VTINHLMIKQIKKLALIFLLFSFVATGTNSFAQRKTKGEPEPLTQFQVNQRKELFMNAAKERILGNYRESERLYRAVLEIDPNHDASMYELARIYLAVNRPADAALLLERANIINPDNEWYLQLLADVYKQTYQIDKLIATQERLVKIYPDKIDYKLDLSLIYVISGDVKKAIAVLDEIEDMIGKTEEISLQKQRLYLSSNKPKQALAEIEALVNAYPENLRYLQILAETYLETGQEAKALEIYARVKEIDPENPYIHISMADLYKKQGQEAQAIEELKLGFANPFLNVDTKIQVLLTFFTFEEFYNTKKEILLELTKILAGAHPDNHRALAVYGEMLYRNQDYEAALEIIDQVIEKDESAYSIWEQKLFIENEIRQSETVLATSNRMIDLFPMQPLAYLFNGFANYQMKNYDAARRSLENGVNLVVDNDFLEAQFYSTLGDVYNRLKDFRKSDESYEKALKLKPDDAFVLNNYAYYLTLRMENLTRAREMAARANELMPDKPSFEDTYGWVLYKMGEYAEAEKWIKKAIDHDTENSPVLLEHYGDVLYKLGNKTEALIYWKKAAENNKDAETSEFLDKKISTGTIHE